MLLFCLSPVCGKTLVFSCLTVFDAQGKLVGTLAQTPTTRRMANTVKQENAKALPQTGDKQNSNTTVGAILVGLGSLLGLGALGKRKED